MGKDVLTGLTSKGKHPSQRILRALLLLACDEGKYYRKRSKSEEIARVLNTSRRKIAIDRAKKCFVLEGFGVALRAKEGWVIPPEKNGSLVAHMEMVLNVYKRVFDP